MHRLALLVCCALAACNAHQEAALEADPSLGAALEEPVETPEPPVAEVEQAVEVLAEAPQVPPVPPVLPVDGPTPQMLYDKCHDRLEGAEADGECTVDADCGRAGCSQEVCVPVAAKGDVITTCEILPCFGATEACGCHEGRCTWSLKERVEPMLPKLPIQVQ